MGSFNPGERPRSRWERKSAHYNLAVEFREDPVALNGRLSPDGSDAVVTYFLAHEDGEPMPTRSTPLADLDGWNVVSGSMRWPPRSAENMA